MDSLPSSFLLKVSKREIGIFYGGTKRKVYWWKKSVPTGAYSLVECRTACCTPLRRRNNWCFVVWVDWLRLLTLFVVVSSIAVIPLLSIPPHS